MSEHPALPAEFEALAETIARWVSDGPTGRARAQFRETRDEMQALRDRLQELLDEATAEDPPDELRAESLDAWIDHVESVMEELSFFLTGIDYDADDECAERLERASEALAKALGERL